MGVGYGGKRSFYHERSVEWWVVLDEWFGALDRLMGHRGRDRSRTSPPNLSATYSTTEL